MSRIRRLLHRRSFQWVAGGLVLLLALWLAVRIPAWRDRQAGIAEHAAVHQRLRDQGLDVTVADRLARLPVLDPQRQAEAKRLLAPNPQPAWMERRALSQAGSDLRRRTKDPRLAESQADVVSLLRESEADVVALSRLLAAGPVVAGSLGWEDAGEDPRRATAIRFGGREWPMFFPIQAYSRALLLRAQVGNNPIAALTVLDRLRHAFDHPGGLGDDFTAYILDDAWDRGMLALLQSDPLPDGLVDAWLAEPNIRRDRMADALAMERIQTLEHLYHIVMEQDEQELDAILQAMGISASSAVGVIDGLWRSYRIRRFMAATWRYGPEDIAAGIRLVAGFEVGLRSGSGCAGLVQELEERTRGMEGVQRLIVSRFASLPEEGQFQWEQHRLVRAAARVIRAHRTTGLLPTDELAFLALQPAGSCGQGPGASRIRYLQLDEHRFKVHLDPEASAPGWNLERRIRSDLANEKKNSGSNWRRLVITIDLSDPLAPEADF